MRVRWFGDPWPSDDLRAPVCEDDEYHFDVPVGYRCFHCEQEIGPDDQGIIMAWSAPEVENVSFYIIIDGLDYLVCAEHLECMLYATLGLDPRRIREEAKRKEAYE